MFIRPVSEKQLNESELDYSNSFVQKAGALFALTDTGRFIDLKNGIRLTASGAAELKGTDRGPVAKCGLSSNNAFRCAPNSLLEPTSAITVIFKFKKTANAANNGKPVFYGQNSAAPYGPWGFTQSSSAQTKIKFKMTVGGLNVVSPEYTSMSTNKSVVMGGRYDGAAVALFIDGLKIGETAATGSIGDYGTYGLSVGDKSQGGQYYPSELEYLYIFPEEALTDSEIEEISANPWQILKPRRRFFIVPTVATGAYTLTADSGSYSVTGTDAGLKADRQLAADSGSYAITGTDATISPGWAILADSGSYTFTGASVNLTYGASGAFTLTADSGAYSITGTGATLAAGRAILADSGAYSVTGTGIGFSYGKTLSLAAGAYTFAGTNAALVRSSKIALDSGGYVFTGADVTFNYSGASAWTIQANSSDTWTAQTDSSDTWTLQ